MISTETVVAGSGASPCWAVEILWSLPPLQPLQPVAASGRRLFQLGETMQIAKRPTRNDVIECAPINRVVGCFDKDRNPCAFYNFKCPTWATVKCKHGTIMFALRPNQRVQPAATEPAEQVGRGPLGCDGLLGADRLPERKP